MTVLTEGIAPHGGQLINRIATAAEKAEFLALAEKLPRVSLDERALSDLVMIAIGGFSPLKGFMEQDDYEKVVDDMRLINGLPWAIPVTLSVSEEVADPLKEGNWIRLDDSEGNFVGVLEPKKLGKRLSVSKPVIPSTGPTNTFKNAP